MTRKVVPYELMSLDGYADDPGEREWFGLPIPVQAGKQGEAELRQIR